MNKFRILLAVSYLVAPGFSLGQDRIVLDKLSDCNGLTELRTVLDSPVSRHCRAPQGSIERNLALALKLAPDTQLCFLSSVPIARLTGFSCLDAAIRGDRELTCFRAVPESLLENYRIEFDRVYSARAIAYKDAASKCLVGNGDASTAPDSIFPPILLGVAKPRFGFALGIGHDRKGQAYHGYAALNPDLDDHRLGAIEVFDIFRLRNATPIPDAPAYSNKFELEVNDMREGRASAANRLSHQFGLPVIAKMRAVDIKYGGSKDIPVAKRQSDLDAWQGGIGSILEDAGFREPTASELEQMHLDPETMGDLLARNLPFGQRGQLHVSPHVLFLIDDRDDACTAVGEVLVFKPEEGVKVSYGTIAILLIGAGDCHKALRKDETLSDQLIEKATQYMRDEVGNR